MTHPPGARSSTPPARPQGRCASARRWPTATLDPDRAPQSLAPIRGMGQTAATSRGARDPSTFCGRSLRSRVARTGCGPAVVVGEDVQADGRRAVRSAPALGGFHDGAAVALTALVLLDGDVVHERGRAGEASARGCRPGGRRRRRTRSGARPSRRRRGAASRRSSAAPPPPRPRPARRERVTLCGEMRLRVCLPGSELFLGHRFEPHLHHGAPA